MYFLTAGCCAVTTHLRNCRRNRFRDRPQYQRRGVLAEALGEKQVAKLLSETLEEEKQTDLKLTEVTQKAIMPDALAGEEEEEEGGDERGGGRSGRRRKAA